MSAISLNKKKLHEKEFHFLGPIDFKSIDTLK